MTGSKNVLVVMTSRPKRADGDFLRFINIFPLLAKRHRLVLVILDQHGREDYLEPFAQSFSQSYVIGYRPKSSRLGQVRNLLSLRPSFFINGHDPLLKRRIEEELERIVVDEEIDLVHVWSRGVEQFLGSIDIPVVFDLCDAISLQLEEELNKKWTLSGYLHLLRFRRFERNIVANYPVVFVAQRDVDYFQARLRCFNFPNGVDTETFRPARQAEQIGAIVFSGNMGFPPNIDAVTHFYKHGFKELVERHPDVIWYIVGANPAIEVSVLGEDPRVTVTGFVDDIREYLARAQIIVCPMVTGSGIKNKVLEAMAMGKAIVSTPLGVSGIACVDGEHVVVAEPGIAFARKVAHLLGHPGEREQLGRNARRLVESDYSWENTVSNYDQMYRQLTAESGY